MKVGTKSVLFGVHCFLIHPWFVAAAWTRLYGFPTDLRLWISFFVHDLGYLGKPNMDGEEGERHVELGARIMNIFGKEWSDFCKYHSRFYSKRDKVNPSMLCVADKLATAMTPAWVYIPLATLTGEINEYISRSVKDIGAESKYSYLKLNLSSKKEWYRSVREHLRNWAYTHQYNQSDLHTKLRED